MEADWEFEIGGDAPVIEGRWPGLVDLRADPASAARLAESLELPALADALIKLNAANSPVWTSKADVFTPESIDPDELDAVEGRSGSALACYIDLLPRSDQQGSLPFMAERYCRWICDRLHELRLKCCRVDLVIRRAYIAPDMSDLGLTAYLTACGPNAAAAKAQLSECLAAFADVVACGRDDLRGAR